jgi:hypothetical protein
VFGLGAKLRPGQQDLRRAVLTLVGLGPEDGQIGRVLPPGEVGVDRGRRIEDAQGGRRRIKDVHAVSRLALGADDHRQEVGAFGILPDELGDVAEGRVPAVGEPANDERRPRPFLGGVRPDRGAGTAPGRGGRGGGRRANGGVALHGQKSAVGAEAERLDALDRRGLPCREVQEAELVLHGLLFAP